MNYVPHEKDSKGKLSFSKRLNKSSFHKREKGKRSERRRESDFSPLLLPPFLFPYFPPFFPRTKSK